MGVCPICDVDGATQLGQIAGKDATAFSCPRCGKYGIDMLFGLTAPQAATRHLLTAALRRASDAGRFLTIAQGDVDSLVASVPHPRSLFEAIDRLLLLLAGRVHDYWAQAVFDKDTDYPLIVARSAEEMNHLLNSAAALGFFEIDESVITLDGWRRIEQLRADQPNGRQAFVAMSFAPELLPIWEEGLKKGIEDSSFFNAVRVDSLEYNGKIDDRIVAEIRRSALLVADFTHQRAGVYFEAGLAHGLGIPVIWTCRENDAANLHFDTRQYNHIVWTDAAHLRERLDQRIRATVLPRSS